MVGQLPPELPLLHANITAVDQHLPNHVAARAAGDRAGG